MDDLKHLILHLPSNYNPSHSCVLPCLIYMMLGIEFWPALQLLSELQPGTWQVLTVLMTNSNQEFQRGLGLALLGWTPTHYDYPEFSASHRSPQAMGGKVLFPPLIAFPALRVAVLRLSRQLCIESTILCRQGIPRRQEAMGRGGDGPWGQA